MRSGVCEMRPPPAEQRWRRARPCRGAPAAPGPPGPLRPQPQRARAAPGPGPRRARPQSPPPADWAPGAHLASHVQRALRAHRAPGHHSLTKRHVLTTDGQHTHSLMFYTSGRLCMSRAQQKRPWSRQQSVSMQGWWSRPGRTKGRLGGGGQPELGRQRELLGDAALQAARRARVAHRPRSAPTPPQLRTWCSGARWHRRTLAGGTAPLQCCTNQCAPWNMRAHSTVWGAHYVKS